MPRCSVNAEPMTAADTIVAVAFDMWVKMGEERRGSEDRGREGEGREWGPMGAADDDVDVERGRHRRK